MFLIFSQDKWMGLTYKYALGNIYDHYSWLEVIERNSFEDTRMLTQGFSKPTIS